MRPAIIQTMAWAYTQICAGEDPWTALGNFTNAWYGYAKDMRATLVSEPIRTNLRTIQGHPPAVGRYWDACDACSSDSRLACVAGYAQKPVTN
jgi:hypothetical protein